MQKSFWKPWKTPGELYNSILIDTPLSEFFSGFSEADLDEMNIEIIRNTLFKVKFIKVYEDTAPPSSIEAP